MKRQKGFTLVEVVVTATIVAVLMAIAVPSYKNITNSNRMAGEVNSLLGDMQFARGEAIKEGQPVTVCVSTNGTACTGGTAWATGWLVFSDVNGNHVFNVATDAILHVQQRFTGTTPDAFTPTPAMSWVTFNREGFATTAGGFVTTTVELTEPTLKGGYTRCLYLNPVGSATTATHVSDPTNCT